MAKKNPPGLADISRDIENKIRTPGGRFYLRGLNDAIFWLLVGGQLSDLENIVHSIELEIRQETAPESIYT